MGKDLTLVDFLCNWAEGSYAILLSLHIRIDVFGTGLDE